MTQAKLVTATMPDEFDRDLNQELAKLKKIKSVLFSTAVTNIPDKGADWDTVYSAVIIYED